MAIAGVILVLIKDHFTMQRNANMLKILKKVSFGRFYGFLCKNAVPCLSPERTFVLRQNFAIYYVSSVYKVLNGH